MYFAIQADNNDWLIRFPGCIRRSESLLFEPWHEKTCLDGERLEILNLGSRGVIKAGLN